MVEFFKLGDFKNDTELEGKLRQLGISLSVSEVKRIKEILGRDPTLVELYIFNGEWSEHCSYKSSKSLLEKYFYTKGPHVILGPSEDAGIVHIATINGERWGLVISHESHNHPSQVLPLEGAATGIGGIVRDVDCMGARTIGVLDPLRFGNPLGNNRERTCWIASSVVEGIMTYANALGVPNLGGDVYFNDSFDENCLVNVIAIGVVKESDIVHSRVPAEAAKMPYDVILVGKPTDATGFGGAAFASEKLDEDKEEEKKGAVQVHDPFLQNVLCMRKANAEVLRRAKEKGYVLGLKDLGGAGLACATAEMGDAGGFGIEIDLNLVHTSVKNLPPQVIMCAETQERFLLIAPSEFTPEVLKIYNEEWDLPRIYQGAMAKVIGKVIPQKDYIVKHFSEKVAEAPIHEVAKGIRYERKGKELFQIFPEPKFSKPKDLNEILLKVLSHYNVASREYIYRFYDTEVQGNAVIRTGEADAAVIAPLLEEGSPVGVAIAVGGNPFYGRIDPYWGGATAVCEAIRNVAAVGAKPIALTDCLNYGNPEIPEAFWQLEQGIKGVADAAKNMKLIDYPDHPIPIVSGNVSLYNESAVGVSIDPSPIVCCVGALEDYSEAINMRLKKCGSLLYLLGDRKNELGGSVYYQVLGLSLGSAVPKIDFPLENRMVHAVVEAIHNGVVLSAHDISDGGLAVTLAEMAIGARGNGILGVSIDLSTIGTNLREDRLLFSESSGFVLEVSPEERKKFTFIMKKYNLVAVEIGKVTEEPTFKIRFDSNSLISLPLVRLAEAWSTGLEKVLR